MLLSSFIILNRRTVLKTSGVTSCVSKLIQYNGSYKYSRSYVRNIFRKPACTTKLCQYHLNNCSEFGIFKRYKQTSADQGKSTETISQNESIEEPPEKLSLFKRYRKMLKEYWYVLLPVHLVTSAFWFGGFYYAAQCGLDIIPFLEFLNLPEKVINPLRNSSLGYIAVASALYKIATPARYMVTLGGTTVSVKFLTKRGLIKPVPTKAQIKTIIQNKLKKGTTDKQP